MEPHFPADDVVLVGGCPGVGECHSEDITKVFLNTQKHSYHNMGAAQSSQAPQEQVINAPEPSTSVQVCDLSSRDSLYLKWY